MYFREPLVKAKRVKRYKRFLADVELEDGSMVTAHYTNSGSMKTCLEAGVEIIPVQARVNPEKIEIVKELPFEI